MKVMLLWKRCIRVFSCRYFLSRSCSKITCPKLVFGAGSFWCNFCYWKFTAKYSSNLQQMHDLHFGSSTLNYKFHFRYLVLHNPCSTKSTTISVTKRFYFLKFYLWHNFHYSKLPYLISFFYPCTFVIYYV